MGKSQESVAEMSSVCGEFSENAWKKDLCKNCQRSRAEHAASVHSGGSKGGKSAPTKAKRTSITQPPDGKVSSTSALSISKKMSPSSGKANSVDQSSVNSVHPKVENSQSSAKAERKTSVEMRRDSAQKGDSSSGQRSSENIKRQRENSGKQPLASLTKNGLRQPDKIIIEKTEKAGVKSSLDTKSSKAASTKRTESPPTKAKSAHDPGVPDSNVSDLSHPRSALKKSPKKVPKSAKVIFLDNDPEIIGYNGGEDNEPPEEGSESGSTSSGDVDTCLTEEEKQFSLLSLENTRWNADVKNLKMDSPLEEKMKRVASKEFEDAELESLWKPDRFPALKDCDSGKLKVGTYPLAKKSQLRASLEDVFGEEQNERTSSESDISSTRMSRLSSEPPDGYKTPASSREISPALDGTGGREESLASSRTSSVSDVDVPVESFKVKKEKKPRVASAYKVVDINPEPVVKPYGIVDVSSGEVPETYPPPELPSTPAPARSRRSSERTSPARSSMAGDAVSISSNCSSDQDNVSESGTLGRKSRREPSTDTDILSEMSISMQILSDKSDDTQLKAAIKLLDEIWKDEEEENGSSTKKSEGGTLERSPKPEHAPKAAKRGSVMTDSTTDIGSSAKSQAAKSITDAAIGQDEAFQRTDSGRASKGKSHAFEAKMASIAANLDLNKQNLKGKRPAPQPPNSPPPEPPAEPVKSPNKVTSQTPDPTFRFVKVGMIPNTSRPTSPTPGDEGLPEEDTQTELRDQDSPKMSAKANNEARKSGLMSFFSKFLRRGKESEGNGETITVTAMEDTIKFVDKNATSEDGNGDQVSMTESSTDDVFENDAKNTKGTNQPKPKVSPTPMKYAISDIMEEIYGKNPDVDAECESEVKVDKPVENDIPAMMSRSVNFEDNKIPEIMSMSLTSFPTTSNPGHSTVRKEDNPKAGSASPKRSGDVTRREFKITEPSKQGQKSPDISQVRRRVRSPTKRDAPRPVTASKALETKNPMFAKELELRLSKGGMEAKPNKTAKSSEVKKLPAPEPPMSPKSPSPSAPEPKKEIHHDDRPTSMPPAPPPAAQDQELYLPPWESRVCEKIELPCQKGRRSILGRIGGPRKSRPPAPPPPGPVKASVKRAKSITESSLPGDVKKIDRSDISGPILIQGMTTSTTTKAVNRRNTITLGDDSSYASGGSSSQDSGSGSIGSKRSYDDPPEPPSLSPLGSLENLYEPIGPRSQSMSMSLEGYLEPVVASAGEQGTSTAQPVAPKEEKVESPKKILSLAEERELFLASQPIYEEIPNGDVRREEMYPEIKIKPLKTKPKPELLKQTSSPAMVQETVEANPDVPLVVKERPPSQPSSREGTPKPAIRSQTLPRPAPRSKVGEKLSPEIAGPTSFPLHGPPPATGPPGQGRPKPVPRRKPQVLAKPTAARKSTVEQYVAMNRPGCASKNYSLECLRDNFNKITGTNFESLQEILKETETDLLNNNPVVRGTLRWTHFRLCSDSPLFTSNKCVVYQATLPELKSDTTIFQLMIFPKPQQENSQALAHVNWLNILTAFSDNIPVKYLSESLLQVWKLPREPTNQDLGGRVKVHIVVTRYHTYEFLNDYFYSLQESMQVTSDEYYQHFVFVLVQCFRAFLFALERGYSLANIGLQDMNIVSSIGISGKFISIWPKLKIHENGSPDDSMCGNAKRIMQEMILSFTCIEQKFPPRFESAMDRVTELLHQEHAECLSIARAVLEFSLWGPEIKTLEDIMNSNAQEQAFDMWLEVQRASLINKLARISAKSAMSKSVDDLYKMKFLLKSNGASMAEVAKQLWKR